MIGDRPYRRALSRIDVRTEIAKAAGSQSDLEVAHNFSPMQEAGR
jgi:hypothetical protein